MYRMIPIYYFKSGLICKSNQKIIVIIGEIEMTK